MQQGVTVLLVTHDVQLIKRYCNRVLYLDKGRLIYDGDPEEGTEIYLAETRERAAAQNKLVRTQNSAEAVLSYSSEIGHVIEATLSCREISGSSIVVGQGERIVLEVKAKISSRLKHPRIQMTVRDTRGYNLFGFNNLYGGKTLNANSVGEICVRYSFDANLQSGDYAITLRLDDTDSTDQINLIDKKVGIVDFTVTVPKKRFDAVIDLNGRCEDSF